MGYVKACTRCGVTQPLDNFSPHPKARDGRQSVCKSCYSAWQRAYRAARPDAAKAAHRRHYKKHGDAIRAQNLAYYYEHRDKRMEQMRAYNEAHRAEQRENDRRYREAHPEIRAASNAAWRRAHPEWCRDYYHRKRTRRREVFVQAVSIKYLYERDKGRCQLCGGKVKWDLAYPNPNSKTIDHIIPLSVDGATHEPRNCQLAHLRCNVSKGARGSAQLRLVG